MAGRQHTDSWSGSISLPLRYGERDTNSTTLSTSAYDSTLDGNGLNGKAAVFKPLTYEVMLRAGMPFQSMVLPKLQVATGKALGVPELLEAILVQLPIRDLLLAQRVSKVWQTLVQDSKFLQQHLFLQARFPAHIFLITHTQSKGAEWQGNRTLSIVKDRIPAGCKTSGHLRAIEATVNPLLCSSIMPEGSQGGYEIDLRAQIGERIRILPHTLHAWIGSTRGPPSAWKMHITQPPTTRATVSILDHHGPEGTLRKVVIKVGGIRFGDILEAYGMLLAAWTASLKAVDVPAHHIDELMRTAHHPELLVLFNPAEQDLGNSLLIPSYKDLDLVLSRARTARGGALS